MTDNKPLPKCLNCMWCLGYYPKDNVFGCSHQDDPHVKDVTKCKYFQERGVLWTT